MTVSVMTAPLLDPAQGRVNTSMPEGLTLKEMVLRALPEVSAAELENMRVCLVTAKGAQIILPQFLHCTRPRAGVQVIIRPIPGKSALRQILTVVISVVALAFAPAVAGFFGITSKLGISLVAAGLNVVGMMLLNALIPVPTPDEISKKNTYSISGFQNQLRRDEPIPLCFGRHRFAPPFAALSYTEIVGDQQYVRALFCFGYGRLRLSDFKLGETSIDDYRDVDIEVREGLETDDPVTLYPNQVLEDPTSLELTRPYPRDDAGEIISGSTPVETPIRRYTAVDTETASVILGFPSGLFAVNNKGNLYHATVEIRIRQRLVGDVDWIDVEILKISAKERSGFFRQHTWRLPTRGRWQIEVTRLTPESTSTSLSDRAYLSAVQSIRPEYPINFDKPVALVAMRIRATYQLNGALDNFNAIVERYAPVWGGANWADGLSRNPASAYVAALTGPSNPYPVADAEIDWEMIGRWYEFCAAKGLKYDNIHGSAETLADMLLKICAAGRATPRHDGLRWGVVVDRPDDLIVDHINPRNSTDFKWSRQYFDPPHAFRVKFFDETNDYQEAERIVPWVGYTGDITLTEALNLPGKTDPDEIWIEARRRMYELMHRPDVFTAAQDGAVRVATRGDTVMGSFDVLERSQVAARVTEIHGSLIVLDELVSIEPDKPYAIRFREFTASDTIGMSIVRAVTASVGETRTLQLRAGESGPQVGDLVHFGVKTTESIPLKIKGVEAGENFSSILNMVSASPEIDKMTDAEIIPAWNGRVGAAIVPAGPAPAPAAPVFRSVVTGLEGTGNINNFRVEVGVGGGSTAVVKTLRIEHRLSGTSSWLSVVVPVADGGALIETYSSGDNVELRALAIGEDGQLGPYTPIISILIGSNDPIIPSFMPLSSIVVRGGLGNAAVTVAIGAVNPPEQIQLFRCPSGTALDRTAHAAGSPFAVSPGTTAIYIDGDSTRTNLLQDGDFSNAAAWSADASWTITGGSASHSAGVSDRLSQPVTVIANEYYRVSFEITGRTAGSVTPRLSGGTPVDGISVTNNATALDRIQAVAGNTTFELVASADFDGTVDNVFIYLETPASIAAGSYDYYLEPQTVGGLLQVQSGPLSGPIPTLIK
ncbi:TipJ family phage tail tip protein [Profundibacter sp.]